MKPGAGVSSARKSRYYSCRAPRTLSFIGFFLLVVLGSVNASHYRYGVVTWRYQPNKDKYTVRFTFSIAWRWSFYGRPKSGKSGHSCCFHYGDGDSSGSPALSIDSISEDEDWFDGEAQIEHRYPSRTKDGDPFRWRFDGCCRIYAIQNSGSSRWRLIADIDLSHRSDIDMVNRPPASSMMPIVTITEGEDNSFFVDASDDDMDPLTFRLANSDEMVYSGTGSQPPGLSINQGSGKLTWNNPSIDNGDQEMWYTNVIVSDGHSQVGIDFIIRIVPRADVCTGGSACTTCGTACYNDGDCGSGCTCKGNHPPRFISPSPWIDDTLPQCFLPGRSASFLVTAEDTEEPCHSVHLQTAGRPSGSTFEKISSSSNPVQYRFSWSSQVNQDGSHQMSITAGDEEGVSAPETVELFVPASDELPNVGSVSPGQGQKDAQTTLNLRGSNFILSAALYCRFRLENQGDSDWVNRRAIYVNSGHVICVTPARETLVENSNDPGTNKVEIEVSNLANCGLWRTMTNAFEYFDTCPIGSTEINGQCSTCTAGKYQAGTGDDSECVECPPGRYGDSPGLFTSECSGLCLKGHYCPPGSTRIDEKECPPGTYGAVRGLGDSSCSGFCSAGYFCSGGNIEKQSTSQRCQAGYYGTEGSTSSTCSGKCAAGYYCPSASTSRTEKECGSAQYYCPENRATPLRVSEGYYSAGGSSEKTRTKELKCDQGHYCKNGKRYPCPVGRFGDEEGLSSSDCSGPCRRGFFCEAGSSSATARNCAPSEADNPVEYYCPKGTNSIRQVDSGYYTIPESAAESQRESQRACTNNEVCIGGRRFPRIQWRSGCVTSGSTVDTETSSEVDENAEEEVIMSVRAKNHQSDSEVFYRIDEVTEDAHCVDTSGVPEWYSFHTPDKSSLFKGEKVGNDYQIAFEDGAFANYEACRNYSLEVHAEADGFTAKCTIQVNIVNVNEKREWRNSFSSSDLTEMNVNEHSDRGTLIGSPLHFLVVFDEDELTRSFGQELLFSISSVDVESDSTYFSVGSCSGQLTISSDGHKALDYDEGAQNYVIEVLVNDLGDPAKQITGSVSVKVNDVNEAPVFTIAPDDHQFAIFENSTAGSPLVSTDGYISQVKAEDPDVADSSSSLNVVIYSIVSQDSNAFFQINENSGEIFVAPDAPRISYEDISDHRLSLTIKISDSELSTTGDFFIDVLRSNLYPRIDSISTNFFVKEMSSENTHVGTLSASDENVGTVFSWRIRSSTIEYGDGSMTVESPGKLPFRVEHAGSNHETGKIVVNEFGPVHLDFENVARYMFYVEVSDEGTPETSDWEPLRDVIKVTVTVQNVNEAPVVSNQEVRIEERQPSGSKIEPKLNATNPDTGPGGVSEESIPFARPSLRFSISRWADGFSPGDTLEATDVFDIGQTSGQLLSRSVFNHTARSEYRIVIQVTDDGNPPRSSEAEVVVSVLNVNTAPTLVAGQVFQIDENTPGGHVLTNSPILGWDQDPGDTHQLQYEIEEGSLGINVFTIEREGTIKTKNGIETGDPKTGRGSALDFERRTSYRVGIRVSDPGGLSSVGYIFVELNDVNEQPAFPTYESQQFQTSVGESAFAGTEVDFLQGEDVDEGDAEKLTFSFAPVDRPTNSCQYFDVYHEERSGKATISVGNSRLPALSDGIADYCEMLVNVTDPSGLTSDFGSVHIDVIGNNFPPTLPSHTLRVPEDVAPNHRILDSLGAKTHDDDLTLSFAIRSSNPSAGTQMFSVQWRDIEDAKGNVAPLRLRGRTLDFESQNRYELTIEVRNNGPGNLRTINTTTVIVEDVNEAPQIANAETPKHLPENAAPGTWVTTVAVEDPDLAVAGDAFQFRILSYSPQPSDIDCDAEFPFAINESTGEVFVRKDLKDPTCSLDYEKIGKFELEIEVSDNGLPLHPATGSFTILNDSRIFTIQLDDLNDPPIVFAPDPNPESAVSVSENLESDGLVVQVPAFDEDDPHSHGWGLKRWEILDGNDGGVFYIEKYTGDLRVRDTLDFETQNMYNLTIQVSDHDFLHRRNLSDFVYVWVFVVNEDDTALTSVSVTDSPDGFMDTEGGNAVAFEGSDLGYTEAHPLHGMEEIFVIGFGPGGSGNGEAVLIPKASRAAGRERVVSSTLMITRTKYVLLSCEQTRGNSRIECVSVEGIGEDIVWEAHVDYEDNGNSYDGIRESVHLSDLSSSYRSPQLTEIFNDQALLTAGGTNVTLLGNDFGPFGTKIAVTYGPEQDNGSVWFRFEAVTCENSLESPHTTIFCTTSPGVGNRIAWKLSVAGGQSSNILRAGSAHGPPTVHSVFVSSPKDERMEYADTYLNGTVMSTRGEETVRIFGDNFGENVDDITVLYGPVISSDGQTGEDFGIPGPGEVVESERVINVTSMETVSKGDLYVAKRCTLVTPHTILECVTREGVGDRLLWRVRTANTISELRVSEGITTHYAPPILNTIEGEGILQADTRGGERISLSGINIGSGASSWSEKMLNLYGEHLLRVEYGPLEDPTRYKAALCEVTVPHESIRCETVEGTGKGLQWTVWIGGQPHLGYPMPLLFNTSYSPPVVSFYEGMNGAQSAAKELDTRGDTVLVHGSMFGPPGSVDQATFVRSDAVDLEDFMVEGRMENLPPIFEATCTVETPHILLECQVPPGAGSNMVWNITIDGQSSIPPVTRYARPKITAFAGTGAADALTDGGQEVLIIGNNFGPRETGTRNLEWVRFGPDATSIPTQYEAKGCQVMNHTLIRCTLPPGSGTPLYWHVSVSGQVSDASPPWGYQSGSLECKEEHTPRPPPRPDGTEPPHIETVCSDPKPLPMSTAGGTKVRISGRNLGLGDPHATHEILFGEETFPVDLAFFNEANEDANENTNFDNDTEAAIGSLEVYVFTLPAGFGQDIPLQIITHTETGKHFSVTMRLSYDPPVVYGIRAVETEILDGRLRMMELSIRGRSLCRPSSLSLSLDPCPGSTSYATTGPFENCGCLELNLKPEDITTNVELSSAEMEDLGIFGWGSNDTWLRLASPAIKSWNHHAVVAEIPLSQGFVRVSVGEREAQERRYLPEFPAFSTGQCEENRHRLFRTAGYEAPDPEILSLEAFDIQDAQLYISVGGKECRNNTGAFNCVPVGENNITLKCEVECEIPPGEGTGNQIIIDRLGMETDDDSCVLNYAPPVIEDVFAKVDHRGNPLSQWRNVSELFDAPDAYIGRGSVVQPRKSRPSLDKRIIVPTNGGKIMFRGDNFGTTPFGQSRRAFLEMKADGARRDFLPSDTHSFEPIKFDHTFSVLELPENTGVGHQFVMDVDDQTLTHYVGIDYEPPIVDSVNPEIGPTTGGNRVTIRGSNFGSFQDRIAVFFRNRECTDVAIEVPHEEISCITPEYVGVSHPIVVRVDGQSNCNLEGGSSCSVSYNYAPPEVHNISLSEWSTSGGELVFIHGANFGNEGLAGDAFEPQLEAESPHLLVTLEPERPNADVRYTLPNPFASSGLFLHGGEILRYNHSVIEIRTPEGQGGKRHVMVHVAGQSYSLSDSVPVFYIPPSIDRVLPETGPTEGYLIKLEGANFGRIESVPPLGTQIPPQDEKENTNDHVDRRLGTKDSDNGLKIHIRIPGADRRRCGSVLSTFDQAFERWLFRDENGKRPPRPENPYTHTTFFCEVIAGFGRDIDLEPELDGIEGTPKMFSYNAPLAEGMIPDRPDANGHNDAFLAGEDFGAPVFGSAENIPDVWVGDLPCNDPELVSDRRIDCAIQRDIVGPKILKLSVAGYSNLTFPANGYEIDPVVEQSGISTSARSLASAEAGRTIEDLQDEDDWLVEMRCFPDFYGQVGERCMPCPRGGICRGGFEGCLRTNVTDGTCVEYEEPFAAPGFWSEPVIPGNSKHCPEERRKRPSIVHEQCPHFIACQPKEACQKNNTCATGYTGERCSECVPGEYYRRGGLCVECPSNAWVFVTLFIIMIVGLAIGGYIVHKYKFNISFVTIGVDYFQVLAIFANSRVAWPSFLRELFWIMNIFNLNIDVTAPECAMPNVSYEVRWFATMMLPVCVGALLMLVHIVLYVYHRWILRWPSTQRNQHASALIGVFFLMFYFLYLYLTRTIFEVFNCNPTEPPDDWGPGYMQATVAPCFKEGGMHLRLFPFAIVFACVYTLGYPLFVGILLRKNKHVVKTDQLLRCLGIGETKSTNPYLSFRRKFHRMYYHFKPGKWYWILLVIARKFGVAITALMFRRTPSFQLAVALVVLFFSFALHIHNKPYMSMAARKEVLVHHTDKVNKGVKKHVQIKQMYERAENAAQSRREGKSENMDRIMKERQERNATFVFNYTTVETVLLASAVFVALGGIMFQSSRFDDGKGETERDALAIAIAIVIAASVLYFFIVFIAELGATCNISTITKLCESRSNKDSRESKISSQAQQGAEVNYNPMALKKQATETPVSELLREEAPPDKEKWERVRAHILEIKESNDQLRSEVQTLQDESGESESKSGESQTTTKQGSTSKPTHAYTPAASPFKYETSGEISSQKADNIAKVAADVGESESESDVSSTKNLLKEEDTSVASATDDESDHLETKR